MNVYEPSDGFPDPEPDVERTDLGNARLFAYEHGERLRYVVPLRQWLVWQEGRRWRLDDDGAAVRAAKVTVDGMLERAIRLQGDARKSAVRHALASQSEPAIRRMLALAGSESSIAVTPERLDADSWLLPCANGTIDLRTGELRPAEPADLISLGTDVAYDPEAVCPRWERFLVEIFAGDEDLIEFVRRAIGYSLTGDTREHVLFVCHGTGRNGKTTLLETIKCLLGGTGAGGLAKTADFDTFARSRGDRGPRNDIARLYRARFVVAAESSEGRRLDEATVKMLTGGDTVPARFLYGEHFEFRPRFKLWLLTNHRPRVDGSDDAIWARLRLVPFSVSFRGREERDLDAKLTRELPGILAWAVRGCLDWQQDGLGVTDAVTAATREYREAEDTLGAFLDERCEHDPGATVDPKELRDAYEAYCAELGEKAPTASVLGKQLAARGVRRTEAKPRRYAGIRLLDPGSPGTPSRFSNSPHARAYEGSYENGSSLGVAGVDAAGEGSALEPVEELEWR